MTRVLYASKPLTSYSERMPPTVLATLDDTGVKDLRRCYRSATSDHWTIALGFAKQNPELAGLFRDDAPRRALVEPAIEVVDET